jgi:PAS domain S-box-containing protein
MPDLEHMVRRQRVLADFGAFALHSEDIGQVLTEACRLVATAMGTGRALILEIEPDDRHLLVRAGAGWPPEIIGSVRTPMAEPGSEPDAIEAGRPVVTRDIATEDRFDIPAFMRHAGVVALMNVPIVVPGGQPFGLLQVDSTEPRDFGAEDVEFLRTYATILGPVIDRLNKLRALRTTEERFRLIVESARDYAIFITDAQDRITDWLPGAEAVFGWTAAEAVGQPARILFTPEDQATRQDRQEIDTARRDGVAPDRRWHLRKDGRRVFIEGAVSALRNSEGVLQGFLKIGQDVTARRETEERLRTSEDHLRRIFETETVGVLVFDQAGTITEANDSFLRMTGYTRADVASGTLTWRRLTPPEWTAESERQMALLATTGRLGPYEKAYIRQDGSRAWMLFAGHDLGNGAYSEFCIDTTQRKLAEAALHESQARVRALIEGIPHLVFRADGAGARTWSSPQWLRYAGQTQDQSLGAGWLDAVHPDDRTATLAAWQGAEARGLVSVEHRIRRAQDGAWRWFQSRTVPIREEPDGAIVEWIGTATDIDDQVRAREVLARDRDELERRVAERTADLMAAEATLRQAQKMEAVGQLTGGIAHDFNNMLQGIRGAVELAQRRIAQGSTDVRRYLVLAQEALDRAAALTQRLLAFARRQRLEPKLVDADGLVAGLAELIRRTMGPGIAVELKLRLGRACILCDPNELESTLLNLCINARDAMPEGGRLAISTGEARLSAADIPDTEAQPGPYVTIAVADTGMGMPPQVVERVFEPFFTTKPQGQGTGLGLSQVYGFVRQSGGFVRIDSRIGRGTTVRLFIPLQQDIDPAPHAPAAASASPGGTVLLVEGEAAIRRPAADRLRELGVVVVEAADAAGALRVAASRRVDLLITDVGLPNGLNGRQLAEAMREQAGALPVLFITSSTGTVLPAGFEVIGKPFALAELAQRVQAMLRAARGQPEPDRSQPPC